jgi:hypothetical protein
MHFSSPLYVTRTLFILSSVRSNSCVTLSKMFIFYGGETVDSRQIEVWRTTLCQLCATTYS